MSLPNILFVKTKLIREITTQLLLVILFKYTRARNTIILYKNDNIYNNGMNANYRYGINLI